MWVSLSLIGVEIIYTSSNAVPRAHRPLLWVPCMPTRTLCRFGIITVTQTSSTISRLIITPPQRERAATQPTQDLWWS